MSLNNITSAELRTLISIVERKERVQEELKEIESKLSTYLSPEPITPATQSARRTRKSRAVRVSKPPLEAKAPKSKVQQAESKSGQRHGALKDTILAALQKATERGYHQRSLEGARRESPEPSWWFSSTGEKSKALRRLVRVAGRVATE